MYGRFMSFKKRQSSNGKNSNVEVGKINTITTTTTTTTTTATTLSAFATTFMDKGANSNDGNGGDVNCDRGIGKDIYVSSHNLEVNAINSGTNHGINSDEDNKQNDNIKSNDLIEQGVQNSDNVDQKLDGEVKDDESKPSANTEKK